MTDSSAKELYSRILTVSSEKQCLLSRGGRQGLQKEKLAPASQPLTTQEIVTTCFCTVVFAVAIAAVTAQAAAASEETKISDNSEALCKFDPQALPLPSSVVKFLAALDERLPVVDHPSDTK
jgi:hypothetical protein